MNRSLNNWRRVNKTEPCPVCNHPDWCSISADGAACICMRLEPGSVKRTRNEGFLHVLNGGHEREASSRCTKMVIAAPNRNNLDALMRRYKESLETGPLAELADQLGLTPESLTRLGVGWSVTHGAYAFPMSDGKGRVLGIRLRLESGKKFAVAGGREGLFIPRGLGERPDRLFVAEGASDTVALLDLGLDAVGRPSCTGGVRLLTEFVQRTRPAGVVIVADADEPGQRGAESLALVLALYCADVRVVTPPPGVKDAREWKLAGATAEAVQTAASAAAPRRLAVHRRDVSREC